jgi:LysR family transcriptional regulator for metE and metH
MELKELRSFAEIASTGSITNAAKKLNLSPPAIHKQLKAMEQELGVQLYEKHGTRLVLTQPAQLILPIVQGCLAQFTDIAHTIEEWKGLRKGVVRIGTGPAFSSYVLPNFLRAFRRRQSQIDIVIQTGTVSSLLAKLQAGDLDLALVVWGDQLDSRELKVEKSWEMEVVLVGTLPNLPARCSLQQLQSYPFILFEYGMQLQSIVDNYLSNLGFQPRVIMRLDNPEAIKALVKQQFGLSLLALWTVNEELRRGEFQRVRLHEPPLLCKVALVSRQASSLPAPARAFLQLAQQLSLKPLRLVSAATKRARTKTL